MALFKRKRKPAGPDDVRTELEWILDNAWGLCLTDATLTAASLHELRSGRTERPNANVHLRHAGGHAPWRRERGRRTEVGIRRALPAGNEKAGRQGDNG